MPKNLPIGVDVFADVIAGDYLLCDKSLLIKELIDRQEKVTLITRPRRWGKTLNMSMLQHFFAEKANGMATKGMFDKLKIATADGGKYMQHQGRYPVIFVTLKDVEKLSFIEATKNIRSLIQAIYFEHQYLLRSDKLEDAEKRLLQKFLDASMETEIENSLKFLSSLLYKHYQQKVFIIIDEYDTPLNTAYIEGYVKEMTQFMHNFFSATFKTNPSLQQGIMTGILRISKDSMLSGLNNLKTYTILDAPYKEYFGFTDSEVAELFQKRHTPDNAIVEVKIDGGKLVEMRDWYNGYKIGGLVVYNPWSIINYLSEEDRPDLYWVNTGKNDLIKEAIINSDIIKRNIDDLMEGKPISAQIDPCIMFDKIYENEMAMWSLLLFAGYLRVESSEREAAGVRYRCQLSIPNQEIRRLYNSYIVEWFEEKLTKPKYSSFLKNLTQGKAAEFIADLGDYLLKSASAWDVGEKKGEQFYHGFMFGLVGSLRSSHVIKSNIESGLGRYDLMLIPKDPNVDLGVVLEFKHAKEDEYQKRIAEEALEQINANQYDTQLTEHPHVKRVLKVGIAFSGKSAIGAYETTDLEGKSILIGKQFSEYGEPSSVQDQTALFDKETSSQEDEHISEMSSSVSSSISSSVSLFKPPAASSLLKSTAAKTHATKRKTPSMAVFADKRIAEEGKEESDVESTPKPQRLRREKAEPKNFAATSTTSSSTSMASSSP